MNKEISMFQQLIFSILMRHKDELYSHLDKMILEQVNETKIDDIIRKMFYEIKMPNMDEKITAFINNEFLHVVGKYVDNYDIQLKVQQYIDKLIKKDADKAFKKSDIDNDNNQELLIEDFEHDHHCFSVRTVNCLKAEGVRTINKLLSWCEHQLLKTPNLGKKSLVEIKTLLAYKNLKLSSEPYYDLVNGRSKCQNCSRM